MQPKQRCSFCKNFSPIHEGTDSQLIETSLIIFKSGKNQNHFLIKRLIRQVLCFNCNEASGATCYVEASVLFVFENGERGTLLENGLDSSRNDRSPRMAQNCCYNRYDRLNPTYLPCPDLRCKIQICWRILANGYHVTQRKMRKSRVDAL